MRLSIISLVILFLQVTACRQQPIVPLTCMEYEGMPQLLIFVGEKISFTEIKDSVETKFRATYKINEIFCGDYMKDTIQFIVHNYAIPVFSKYANVMLYLVKHDSIFYQSTHDFHDVYRDRNGRWAGPYRDREYKLLGKDSLLIRPEKIDFSTRISYDISGLKKRYVDISFPSSYYLTTKNKATTVWGNYLPELFILKQKGILRHYYTAPPEEFDVVDTKMAEIRKDDPIHISKRERKELTSSFWQLINAVKANQVKKIEAMSQDSIFCSICEGVDDYNDFENSLASIRQFIDTSCFHFHDTLLWGNTDYKLKISAWRYDSYRPVTHIDDGKEDLIVYSLYLHKSYLRKTRTNQTRTAITSSHRFSFVKIDGKYKFTGMSSY